MSTQSKTAEAATSTVSNAALAGGSMSKPITELTMSSDTTPRPGGAMSRRAFVRGLPLIGASIAVPAVAAPVLTPEQRIELASAEIVAAMAELHPGWRQARVTNDTIPALNQQGQRIRVARHAVLIFASEEKYGPEQGMWWCREVNA